ncbi:MAG: hypothetical protein COW11_04070 [Candidatus Omnitrophica bacterium CG12_big_fil_rev_8_21_14_0_65_43_15]|uniref:Uncharacterized protein n=1 Tax=Candidatus Taenaricola geysiri TaxID=1974752 RepID=A0A2J0LJS0_9BACT|nr:MAG: hypothetical protein COU52_01795 [Candidatus Omnitrophica bacterium CG10_big_fil_rev_8_21_14_0_10_43_8]PIV11919.1 MAG: hypothetical protein COS48_03495 [Candidatus Omnitrophica bacterium CG03_land_8_20_14_0_80_43_22]PIW66290.1 MAG: hypothetical protein COW11_04070 [Candidatus Omnitrophica bacterium CG12_big_fil_rev_8_21_14_0_65_43_15]PIW80207.1 MAG: hypothetical protein COZ98_03465 [Candidatus Omnitrophica bacterium CG_4_8_14_3_um_filter_43_15]PIY84317.1 MAG: hypothetical protein COY77_
MSKFDIIVTNGMDSWRILTIKQSKRGDIYGIWFKTGQDMHFSRHIDGRMHTKISKTYFNSAQYNPPRQTFGEGYKMYENLTGFNFSKGRFKKGTGAYKRKKGTDEIFIIDLRKLENNDFNVNLWLTSPENLDKIFDHYPPQKELPFKNIQHFVFKKMNPWLFGVAFEADNLITNASVSKTGVSEI